MYADSVYEAAVNARVLRARTAEKVRPELERIAPMPAVFDKDYVRNLDGANVKQAATRWTSPSS